MIRALLVVIGFVAAVATLPFAGDALFGWRPDVRVLPEAGASIGIDDGRSLNVHDGGAGEASVPTGWTIRTQAMLSLPDAAFER